MAVIPDGFDTSELGVGNPNEVALTGEAYLDAARVYRIRLIRKARKAWLFVPDWYVVHHLCFISAELYLKSFGAKICYTQSGDDSGPSDQFTMAGYRGHGLNDNKVPSEILLELKRTLSDKQNSLLNCLRNRAFVNAELATGRYPYEREDHLEYPPGQEGRRRAEDWLAIAKALRKSRGRLPSD